MTIDDLTEVLNRGFSNIQKQIDDLNLQINDLNLMTGKGFNDVQNQINGLALGQKGLAFEQKEFRNEANTKFSKLEKDMVWVKDILESHTTILKDLDQERIFIVHRTDRIESDVELIKKRLKTA